MHFLSPNKSVVMEPMKKGVVSKFVMIIVGGEYLEQGFKKQR